MLIGDCFTNGGNQIIEIDELIEKGYVERMYARTPSGAAYSEAHFFDDEWNYVERNDAVCILIKEFNNKGEKINESIMRYKEHISGRER